jgi:hypothetical protein
MQRLWDKGTCLEHKACKWSCHTPPFPPPWASSPSFLLHCIPLQFSAQGPDRFVATVGSHVLPAAKAQASIPAGISSVLVLGGVLLPVRVMPAPKPPAPPPLRKGQPPTAPPKEGWRRRVDRRRQPLGQLLPRLLR